MTLQPMLDNCKVEIFLELISATGDLGYGGRLLGYCVRFIVQDIQFVKIKPHKKRADSVECLDKTNSRDTE